MAKRKNSAEHKPSFKGWNECLTWAHTCRNSRWNVDGGRASVKGDLLNRTAKSPGQPEIKWAWTQAQSLPMKWHRSAVATASLAGHLMGHAGPSGSLGQTMLSQYRPIILERSSLQSEPVPSYLRCLTNIQEGDVFATLQVINDK